jgi:hypothetical protein
MPITLSPRIPAARDASVTSRVTATPRCARNHAPTEPGAVPQGTRGHRRRGGRAHRRRTAMYRLCVKPRLATCACGGSSSQTRHRSCGRVHWRSRTCGCCRVSSSPWSAWSAALQRSRTSPVQLMRGAWHRHRATPPSTALRWPRTRSTPVANALPSRDVEHKHCAVVDIDDSKLVTGGRPEKERAFHRAGIPTPCGENWAMARVRPSAVATSEMRNVRFVAESASPGSTAASRPSPRSRPSCVGSALVPRRRSGKPCGWQSRRSPARMRSRGSPTLATPWLLKLPESCSRTYVPHSSLWAAGIFIHSLLHTERPKSI